MRIGLRSGWNIAWTFTVAAKSSTTSRLVNSFAIGGNTHCRASHQQPRNRSIQRLRTTMSNSEQPQATLRFVDIGANLLDERYTDGIYFGKKRHDSDFDLVLERALEQGVTHVILTAGTLRESRKALELVEAYRSKQDATPIFLGCTVGVHPTRCQQEFVDKDEPWEAVLDGLAELLKRGSENRCVVAIGEFGLDYDRLEFTPKDIQIEYFQKQLDRFLGLGRNLPLFLHNRSVGRDLLEIILEHKGRVHPETGESLPLNGVVHSFDDSLELAQEFIDLGLYIGLNGCSLKTPQNIEVVKKLPLDRILLETDCPYCEIKATHAGHHHIQTTFAGMKKADKKFEAGKMVKGRNEPSQIVQVAEVVAGVKGISLEEVASACYQNSMTLYGGFAT